MVVCNISLHVKSLNVHLAGLYHGFICGQLTKSWTFIENGSKGTRSSLNVEKSL